MSNQFRPMAGINVIPFVDVILVLLIIFMITMPSMLRQLPIHLLNASTKGHKLSQSSLEVTLDAHRRLLLSLGKQKARPYAWGKGLKRYQEILGRGRFKQLIIFADKQSHFQDVMTLLAFAKKYDIKAKLAYQRD